MAKNPPTTSPGGGMRKEGGRREVETIKAIKAVKAVKAVKAIERGQGGKGRVGGRRGGVPQPPPHCRT